jgi:hypothetical protein
MVAEDNASFCATERTYSGPIDALRVDRYIYATLGQESVIMTIANRLKILLTRVIRMDIIPMR